MVDWGVGDGDAMVVCPGAVSVVGCGGLGSRLFALVPKSFWWMRGSLLMWEWGAVEQADSSIAVVGCLSGLSGLVS